MEKLNPVRRQCPCNQSAQENEKQSTCTSAVTCDALRHLVPFVQFKKCEKHSWRSVNFSKAAG